MVGEKMTSSVEIMTSSKAIDIVDGYVVVERNEYLQAWQHLVDTGLCWQLQGRFGRMAAALIEEGQIKKAERNED